MRQVYRQPASRFILHVFNTYPKSLVQCEVVTLVPAGHSSTAFISLSFLVLHTTGRRYATVQNVIRKLWISLRLREQTPPQDVLYRVYKLDATRSRVASDSIPRGINVPEKTRRGFFAIKGLGGVRAT